MTSYLFDKLLDPVSPLPGYVTDDGDVRPLVAMADGGEVGDLERITAEQSGQSIAPRYVAPEKLPPLRELSGVESRYPAESLPMNVMFPNDAVDVKTTDVGSVPIDKDGNPLPWVRRPGMLPVTKDPDGSLRLAMPNLPEIVGNILPSNVPATLGSGLRLPLGKPNSPVAPEVNNGFYSKTLNAAQNLNREKGTVQDFYNDLKNTKGVKPDELKWTGMDDLVKADPQKKWTKEELVDHIDKNQVKVQESVRSREENPNFDSEYEKWWNTRERLAAERRELTAQRREAQRAYSEEMNRAVEARDMNNPRLQELSTHYNEIQAKEDEALSRFYDHTDTEPARELSAPKYADYSLKTGHNNEPANYGEAVIQKVDQKDLYKSSHWEEKNPIAHYRFSDRTGPNGEKILHVEEKQSDWGQAAREHGVKTPEEDAKFVDYRKKNIELDDIEDKLSNVEQKYGVDNKSFFEEYQKNNPRSPSEDEYEYLDKFFDFSKKLRRQDPEYQKLREQYYALEEELRPLRQEYQEYQRRPGSGPFIDKTPKWSELTMKHILNRAQKGNYDAVTWSPGNVHAERYEMNDHFSSLEYNPQTSEFTAIPRDKNHEAINAYIPKERLPEFINSQLTERLLATPPGHNSGTHFLTGDDLISGGEGHRTYYDQMVPKMWSSVLKPHDPSVQIEKLKINHGILPKMIERENGVYDILDKQTGKVIESNLSRSEASDLRLWYEKNPDGELEVQGFKLTPKAKKSIEGGQTLFVKAVPGPLPQADVDPDENRKRLRDFVVGEDKN